MSSGMRCLLLFALLIPTVADSQANPSAQTTAAAPQSTTTAIEYYYKVKWGHQEEFLSLFRKNHLPILKKQIETGRIVSVAMDTPRYHMPENERWDYRVTIVFNAARANEGDPPGLIEQLYPDQATFKREEQRRFEILDAHWDVPINKVDLDKK